jgi:polysaccharide export outer membrane protein
MRPASNCWFRWHLAVLGCFLVSSCSSTRPRDSVSLEQADPISSLMSHADRARLDALAATRTRAASSDEGYRVGPDDLLEIRIIDLFDTGSLGAGARRPGLGSAAIPDVTAAPTFQQGLRVTADGDVNIPQLGVVRVAGYSARVIEDRLARQLIAAGILHRPQVSVTVVEYRSNVVAVVGSVQRPGVYPLTRPGATIADLIWAAGGPTREAGRIVQFAPAAGLQTWSGRAHPADGARRALAPAQLASAAPLLPRGGGRDAAVVDSDAPPLPAREVTTSANAPIRIDLDALLQATAKGMPDLNPPARPGDVINLVPAGTVLVAGWVEKPGPYPITRSLTLAGAVAAAGGHTFPADQRHATVRRVLGAGEERVFVVDIDAISTGQEPDMPIVDGDVVTLPADSLSLVPWGLWTFVSTVFRVGWSLAVL